MNFVTNSFLPLLARLVIGAIMLTSGWVNCFGQIEIREGIAIDLAAMDISTYEQVSEDATGYSTDPNRVVHTTRGLNRIVWLVHQKWPDIGSWATIIGGCAAGAQLLAGVLLIVGLFTRFATFLVLVASGGAVYLVAVHTHSMFTMNPFEWPLDSHRFMQLFAGLMLCVLSLQLLVSGAGGLSIDARHRGSSGNAEKKRDA
ncbi:MAG: DoxX family protein [Phycisphaerales bacterium]|nr:DoxX family protein [Phycisphaerales bacterium]